MEELKRLFNNNKKWVNNKLKKNPNFFTSLSKSHTPKYLWIGCSDSRVPANEIVGLDVGELLVHRNIGNLCPINDINYLSVLEYAVNFLKIKHVIVCGHYGCGGIKTAMGKPQNGTLDHWLKNIKDTYDDNKNELDKIKKICDRYNYLAELNVKQQVLNICDTSIVQQAWARKQPLWIHGWVYNLKTGLLKDLNLCFSNIDQIKKSKRY